MSETRCYYLSERRRGRRRRGKSRILLLLAILLSLCLLFHLRLAPLLLSFAEQEAANTVEQLLSAAIGARLSNDPTLYSDVITLAYKADGSIAALTTDTARLISIRTDLCRALLAALTEEEEMVARVPVASLFGFNALSSSRSISLRLRLLRSMNAYFTSSFEERGINQTRHRISFVVTVSVDVLIPSRKRTVTVTREFPFAETVIVGDVPDAYTKIDRLTDDITETEIDDLYDYGAVIN